MLVSEKSSFWNMKKSLLSLEEPVVRGVGFSDKFEANSKLQDDEDVEEEMKEHTKKYMETKVRTIKVPNMKKTMTLGEGKVDADNETEEREDASLQVEGESTKDYDYRDIQSLVQSTKPEERREKRQERAWREKEGNRRQKEGLPRNFLLVDEHTRKSYSMGVGDWRKEVMLLSQDLDPAIGNINRQSEGAVAEIVDWIQHTWEHSFPVKYEYVKEVIACGVTLRRSELWKKIRNGEQKPDRLSDRTWRMLQRQLESPTSLKKSENCRKANASRVNFGRTGPSREIGVWQRLRRILRRPLDLAEVMYKMSRDKGYGGRHRNEECFGNVMHGSGQRVVLVGGVKCIYEGPTYVPKDTNNETDEEKLRQNESEEVRFDESVHAGNTEKLVAKSMSSMSVEHILEHPFVVHMMQRLQALEGKENEREMNGRPSCAEELNSIGANDGSRKIRTRQVLREKEYRGKGDHSQSRKIQEKKEARLRN